MANRIIVSTVEAVKDELQTAQDAGTFGALDWRAARSYQDWDIELATADYERIWVDVVALNNSVVIDHVTNSTGVRYHVPVVIAIRQKLGPADESDGTTPDRSEIANESIDQLVDLTEQIAEFFPTPSHRLTTYNEAVWESSTIRSFAGRDHLRMWQYTGIVEVVHTVDKELST